MSPLAGLDPDRQLGSGFWALAAVFYRMDRPDSYDVGRSGRVIACK